MSGIQKPLSERLKVTHLEAFDPIPPQLLRKVKLNLLNLLIAFTVEQL